VTTANHPRKAFDSSGLPRRRPPRWDGIRPDKRACGVSNALADLPLDCMALADLPGVIFRTPFRPDERQKSDMPTTRSPGFRRRHLSSIPQAQVAGPFSSTICGTELEPRAFRWRARYPTCQTEGWQYASPFAPSLAAAPSRLAPKSRPNLRRRPMFPAATEWARRSRQIWCIGGRGAQDR
jgi:hypothetical protein